MKYLQEFREPRWIRALVQALDKEVKRDRSYRLMEFCGGHTHSLYRYGLMDLLPDNVRMVHGPGCPVCVIPSARLDMAMSIAEQSNTILCTYADMLRVPAIDRRTLLKVRAGGADVRMVYSSSDALRIAEASPDKQVVFFAIGFETTTPPTALVLKQAKQQQLKNFSVFCNHVLTPAAMLGILAQDKVNIDGFVGPGNVSTVIGSDAYGFAARDYQKPVVISGFEPADLLHSILLLIRQLNEGRTEVENEYARAVSATGNPLAKELMAEVFSIRKQFEWRGLGIIADSALQISPAYSDFDAEKRLSIESKLSLEHKACECADILCGRKRPQDCKVFATACTPETPLGSCMVSSEGACAAYYSYGRHRLKQEKKERIDRKEKMDRNKMTV